MTETERVDLVAGAQQRIGRGLQFLVTQALDETGFRGFVDELLSWADGAIEPVVAVTRRERKMVALARDFETLAELLPAVEYGELRWGLHGELSALWQAQARRSSGPVSLLDP